MERVEGLLCFVLNKNFKFLLEIICFYDVEDSVYGYGLLKVCLFRFIYVF